MNGSMTRCLVLLFAGAGLVGAQDGGGDAIPLTVLQTLRGTLLEGGEPARYSFSAGPDTFLVGEVEQIGVDVVVRILDPGGKPRGRFDGPERGPERFVRRLDEAGDHVIEVSGFEGAAGDFAITLLRLEPVESDPALLTDQMMSPYAGEHSPGCAVQVWRGDSTLFAKAYGMASLSHGIPFETGTRTNIGSTSKHFTAFAVLLQAEAGALSLDDDIRRHVPELPDFGETIIVRHLLTHTSGLREFLNLLSMSGRRLDHGDWIGRDELIEIVQRQPALQNSPGTEWNYNNTAFGLAALIVERTSGQGFHDFMRERVFEPLGMDGTMVRPTPEHIVPNGSVGYTPGKDGFRAIGDLGGAVGAGCIYSTVGDLETWVRNFMNPRVGRPEMFEEMMTPYPLKGEEAKDQGYGYGLFIDEHRGLRRVHHGGADVAHRSMLAYYPQIHAGVTVQSNHAAFDSSVAFELAEAFFADAMEPEKEEETKTAAAASDFDPATYEATTFDEFAGRYSLDAQPGFVLTFSRDGDELYAQGTGQPRLKIVPTSATTFQLVDVEASVEFLRDDDGKVEGLTLIQNGENHATRLEDEDLWKPGAEALQEFTGRYFSEELETFYTIVVEDAVLVVQHRRLDDVRLSPGEKDRFSGGNLEFSFERDRNRRVLGFYLANGRTRDVRFERQGPARFE